MKKSITIKIDFSKKCKNCGETGIYPNGFCIECTEKYIMPKVLRNLMKQK